MIALVLIGASIISFLILAQKQRNPSRYACCMLLLAAAALTLSSAFLLLRLDHIVHYDLYAYGLQFSNEWATKYWTYTGLLLALNGLASAIAIASITAILLSARRTVRITPARLTGSILVAIGATALAASTVYASTILAFVGLGLVFWGIIFAYIQTEEYVKKTLLEATITPYLATLNEIIQGLEYKGDAVYLPPKYLSEPEAYKAFIPKQKETRLPKPEQMQKQEIQFYIDFIEDPPAVLLTPPGAELTKLFEKTLQTNFIREDIQYIQRNMPKLFIEDLEIAQNFEMETEKDKVLVKIENTAISGLSLKTEQTLSINSTLGFPVTSAIACALAKSTGKPVIIEKQETSEDGRNITIEYRMLEEEEQAAS
jgi:hypothetical protein